MASKYIDISSIVQVIGCVYNNPSLLDRTDKYKVHDEDFSSDFHKVIYGSIYNLHAGGVKTITIENIFDFLSTRPKYESIFKVNRGDEWLYEASKIANPDSFDYYYNKLKKMTLLRMYDNYGVDVTDIYDPNNILDLKKKQLQEDILDNSSLLDIANKIDEKIDSIKYKYVNENFNDAYQAGHNIFELLEGFKENPEVGVPLYGDLINSINRGARLKKFYLRSAATGTGKTRSMIADACFIGCNKIYDSSLTSWIDTGVAQPTLFITTEQSLDEIQTMMLAFLSEVNEEHIISNTYVGDEEDRVFTAAQVLSNSPIFVEELPDFSLDDIESVIKKNIRDNDVKYIFQDYIHTSLKILEEISRKSGGVKLREDNILFMLSNKLKDICNQYGVFIMSATQLNGDFKDAKSPDQNLLRGAKSIADKIDFGAILLDVTQEDLQSLESILSTNTFDTPNLKLSIYKNRRGSYKGVYLWCKADLGCCRIKPMFCTKYNYDLVNVNNLKIIVEDKKGAF